MSSPALRRCFELAGVVPLAVFVVIHVLSYTAALFGQRSFGVAARDNVLVLALELVLVWLPLAFHAGYGLWLVAARAAPGAAAAPAASDAGFAWRALGLRVSGVGLLAFLTAHLLWLALPLWSGERDPEDVHELLIATLSATSYGLPLVALSHLAGLALVALHLGLGLSRFAEGWGIGEARGVRRAATLVSIVLFVAGAASIVGLATGSALPRFLH